MLRRRMRAERPGCRFHWGAGCSFPVCPGCSSQKRAAEPGVRFLVPLDQVLVSIELGRAESRPKSWAVWFRVEPTEQDRTSVVFLRSQRLLREANHNHRCSTKPMLILHIRGTLNGSALMPREDYILRQLCTSVLVEDKLLQCQAMVAYCLELFSGARRMLRVR